MLKNPIQPLYIDSEGTLRFKKNEIVDYILENGGIDLNQIAQMTFSQDDREQFAQLIGYSLSGYGDLSYVSDETWYAAELQHKDENLVTLSARVLYLEEKLRSLKEMFSDPLAELYGKHVSDF